MGRWRSDAFLTYLSMSNHMAKEAQMSMAGIGEGDITAEEHRCYKNWFD